MGDKAPEAGTVVHFAQVTKLVNDQVVDHFGWALDEFPVEGEVLFAGAGAPFGGLRADKEPGVAETVFCGQFCDSLCKVATSLGL